MESMKRYTVTEKEIVKEKANLNYSFGAFLTNMQEYINKVIVNHLKIKLEPSLELVSYNGLYLIINDEIIYKPICKLLNIEYTKAKNDNKLEYYQAIFRSKISELKTIKSEEELFVKFPYIHFLYTKENDQLAKALDVYNLVTRTKPNEVAISLKTKLLIKYDINEELYNRLLMESPFFNLAYFMNSVQNDLTNLVNNLSMISSNITSYIVSINKLPEIDKNKVSSILTNEKKLKR